MGRFIIASSIVFMIGSSLLQGDVVRFYDRDTVNFPNLYDASSIPPGVNRLVNDHLDATGINELSGGGMDNATCETDLEAYMIPTGTTDLFFELYNDGGSWEFDFGLFKLNGLTTDPAIDGIEAFATEALHSSNVVIEIFDDHIHQGGETRTIDTSSLLAPDDIIGFFIIPNNTLDAFRANPGLFFDNPDDLYRSPLFSMHMANPGSYDQMLSFNSNEHSDPGLDLTMFTFEDVSRTLPIGDQDFDDITFTVTPKLSPVVPEPGSVLSFVGLGALGLVLRRRRV